MPLFVVIMALLSILSVFYSMKVLGEESHRLELVAQPFGGGLQRMMEQVLRVGMATLFTALSILSLVISLALIWLSLQPSMVG